MKNISSQEAIDLYLKGQDVKYRVAGTLSSGSLDACTMREVRRLVTIGANFYLEKRSALVRGVTVIEPESECLTDKERYYTFDICTGVAAMTWTEHELDYKLLVRGLVWKTERDAHAAFTATRDWLEGVYKSNAFSIAKK